MAQAQQKPKKKTGLITFFKQVKSESKKISWPSRKETTASTISVFFMVTLAAIFLYFSDQLIAWVVRMIMSIGLDV